MFVRDVVNDLGLDVKRLVWARLVLDSGSLYVALNQNNGHVIANDKIDKETLKKLREKPYAPRSHFAALIWKIVIEDPLELFSLTIEIQDINDQVPVFPEKKLNLNISESTPTGTIFFLDSVADPTVGINCLQSYTLRADDSFVLKQST